MSRKNPNFVEKVFKMIGLDPFTTEPRKISFYNMQEQYLQRLLGISIGAVTWENLPSDIDVTILERMLNNSGIALLTFDSDIEKFILLTIGEIKKYDIYGRPLEFEGRSLYGNAIYENLNTENTVIIYDNNNYCSPLPMIEHGASHMAQLRLTMDSNIYQLRTPIIVKTTKETHNSVKIALDKYDKFEQTIVLDKAFDEDNNISVIDLKVQNHLKELREEYNAEWNEQLTNIGIPNISGIKKERMISDEVNRLQGGAIASQYIKLQPRLQAVERLKDNAFLNQFYDFSETSVSFNEGFIENARKEELNYGTIYDNSTDNL